MCDKGLVETDPSVMKLRSCIVIRKELQDKIEKGISDLTGEDCFISSPIRGKYPEENPSGTNSVRVETKKDPTTLSNGKIWYNNVVGFDLTELPGCCGVLVSHGTFIMPKYQKRGIGTFLLDIKESIARVNRYSLLMCTTRVDNLHEIHLLEKHGWDISYMFMNLRTDNKILVYVKNLNNAVG